MGLLGKGFNEGDALLSFFGADVRGRKARRIDRAKTAQEEAIVDNLVREAEAAGATPADIALIRANPGKYAEEGLTRFRTREASPDSEIVTPGFGGKRDVYRSASAPPAVQREADYLRGIGRTDLAEALIAKHALTPTQFTNPATGALEMGAVNPAELFTGRTNWGGGPPMLTDQGAQGGPAGPTAASGAASLPPTAPRFPAASAAPQPNVFQFSGIPGDQQTSGYRDPAHNRRVGGVANSFHTRRDANGNPMATDRVPPRGMNMGSYYQQLRQRNPNLDVINERDHVHMEPRGRSSRGQPQSHARLKAEAQAAIRRGADPAAVRQRLREMGVE